MNLQSKKVLITGGSLGIGLQLAKQLLAEGASVMICARNLPALEKAKADVPGLKAFQCNITERAQVEQLFDETISQLGGVDILINNAAVFRRFDLLEGNSVEEQLEEVDINLKGTIQVTNIFLRELLKSPEPMIVNLTSALGFVPMVRAPVYSATKAAINSWTTSLRYQLKNTNAKVVLLSPAVVDTRMNTNNPDVEGMKKMSPGEFSAIAIQGIKKGRQEILAFPINMFKYLSRFMPRQAFKTINKV